jgi:hypothetical protein
MKIAASSIFFLIIAIISLPSASRADYVVADNLPDAQTTCDYWEEVGLISPLQNGDNNVAKGQEFVPQLSGLLTTIDALITSSFDAPIVGSPPLDVSIYTSTAGIPGTLLGTVLRQPSDFPFFLNDLSKRATIDFTQLHLSLAAGQQYMVTFETPFGISGDIGTDAPYFVGTELSVRNPSPPMLLDHYASFAQNGTNWQVFNDRELAIAVHAIPEPNALALFLLVIGAPLCNPRNRHSRS